MRRRFGCPADRPLALMQFGGFEGLDPLRDWPEQDQVHWVVQDLAGRCRRDAAALSGHWLEVLDVLEALVTAAVNSAAETKDTQIQERTRAWMKDLGLPDTPLLSGGI